MLWTNLKLIAGFLLLLEVLRTLWQVGSPAPKVIPQAGRVAAVAWSPDSKMLAVSTISYEAFERGDGTKVFIDKSTVTSWDVSNAKAKWSLEEEEKTRITSLAFSGDGKTLAIGVEALRTVNADEVRLVDTEQGTLKQAVPFGGELGGFAYSPNGMYLALAGRRNGVASGVTSDLFLWDIAKKEIKKELSGRNSGGMSCLAFSPDSKLLSAVESDNSVRLYDAESLELKRTLEGHIDRVRAVAFSPDGKMLASRGQDKTVRLWDVHTGKFKRTFSVDDAGHPDIVFSSDGKLLATAAAVKKSGRVIGADVSLWDIQTGKLRQRLPVTQALTAMAFSPDGSKLAGGTSGSKEVKYKGAITLWSLQK